MSTKGASAVEDSAAMFDSEVNMSGHLTVELADEYFSSDLFDTLTAKRLSPYRQIALLGHIINTNESTEQSEEETELTFDGTYKGIDMSFTASKTDGRYTVLDGDVH